MKYILFFLFLVTCNDYSFGKEYKLTSGQKAPTFNTTDVLDNTVSLDSLKGRSVLLSFRRYTGCPICNARFFEIQENKDFFSDNNVVVIHVYESSQASIKQYLGDTETDVLLIADPNLELYNLYGVERSNWKTLKGATKGVLKSANNQFLEDKPKKDGHSNRIPADFLIDENGNLLVARYQEYLGDEFPIEEIKKEIGNNN